MGELNKKAKILVGSPICQEPEILKEFLLSLEELDTNNIDISYCFVDDNKKDKSVKLLQDFKEKNENVVVIPGDPALQTDTEYVCDEFTHRWTGDLVEKIAQFKNGIIKYFLNGDYDYLFFVDSDLVLHPSTLQSLLSRDKDIIANIFWTKWTPESVELPQVWMMDAYTLYDASMLRQVSQQQANQEVNEFITMLKKPGVYKVGGLGACTLIKRAPLEAGVNFNKIYNISFWGEDRSFCIRAVAYGFDLFVDTHYPAYHIYRNNDLEGVEKFKGNLKNRDLDILGYELIDIVNKFLEKYYNFSYKDAIDYSWLPLFTFEAGLQLQNEKINNENMIIKSKMRSRYRVEEWKLSFYDDPNKVGVTYKLVVEGIKNKYSFVDAGEYTAILVNYSGKWKISSLAKTLNLALSPTPLIRKVKDKNGITLSMVVKNEEGRYLEQVLEQNKKYIQNAVIIDDGSTDKTIQIVKDILGDKNLTLIENPKSLFNNEINLRKLQWNKTIKTNPDWILSVDADELFENSFEEGVLDLINSDPWVDGYAFRLYDMWDMEHYRQDDFWKAHSIYRTFLIRYQKNFNYRWLENPVHCGRLPYNINQMPANSCKYRIKHFGWAKAEDRLKKHARYMKHDPEGKYGDMNQYKSILDPNPRVIKWVEEE
ncbi:MAG: glycosyltransferase family 2 protein [Clostridium sp.]